MIPGAQKVTDCFGNVTSFTASQVIMGVKSKQRPFSLKIEEPAAITALPVYSLSDEEKHYRDMSDAELHAQKLQKIVATPDSIITWCEESKPRKTHRSGWQWHREHLAATGHPMAPVTFIVSDETVSAEEK